MPRKQNPAKDLKDFKGTHGPQSGSVTTESIEAARRQAAGAPAPPYDPALHLAAGREIVDRAKRTVIGRYEIKGRSPSYTLSPEQFAQHAATGTWDGAPSEAEYGPHSAVPEDKEYTRNF